MRNEESDYQEKQGKKSRHYLTLIEGSRSLLCIVPPSHLEDQEALLITHP